VAFFVLAGDEGFASKLRGEPSNALEAQHASWHAQALPGSTAGPPAAAKRFKSSRICQRSWRANNDRRW